MSVEIEDIILKAGDLLKAEDGPIKVSVLGQRLNRELDTSIRKILGNKPLGDAILERFGDTYEVQGHGPFKEIGRIGEWTFKNKIPPKYDDRFWRHFATPLEPGVRRWISPSDPFAFVEQETAPSESHLEIEEHFLPKRGEDIPHRGRFVRHNIETWARAHQFDLDAIEAEVVKPITSDGSRPARDLKSAEFGIRALNAIIDAIPESERASYSLPLNLVARLISK